MSGGGTGLMGGCGYCCVWGGMGSVAHMIGLGRGVLKQI